MEVPSDIEIGKVLKSANCGDFKIISYFGNKEILLRFVSTGYEVTVSAKEVRTGIVKDKMLPAASGVGFIGVGIYKARVNGKKSLSYICWLNMITRCYSKKSHKINPTYIDCEVCEEWQDYQNFAQWYDENHPDDGLSYDLDKDILSNGDKIYSPSTCLFVSRERNNIKAVAKTHRFISPGGIEVNIYNLLRFCKLNNINYSSMSSVSRGTMKEHKGWKQLKAGI